MSRNSRYYLFPLGGVLFVAAMWAGFGLTRVSAHAQAASNAAYLGSAVCKGCHQQVAQGWSGTGHAQALTNPQLPPEQRECEACHGPGSLHVQSTGKDPMRNPAKLKAAETVALCGACHFEGSTLAAGPKLARELWKRSKHARAEQSCTTCHTVHGKNPNALKAVPEQLCSACHSNLTKAPSSGSVHAPVKAGQCLLCHDPHGSTVAHNVKPNIGSICESCHAPDTDQLKAAHQGYSIAGADCTSCHDPHSFAADKAYLRPVAHPPFAQRNCQVCHVAPPSRNLKQPGADTCYTCHPKEQVLAKMDAAGQTIHAHAPTAAGLCTKCHDPHTSPAGSVLRDAPEAVCTFCHKSIGTAQIASHPHPPVAKGECLSCHEGHGTVQPALLVKEESALCQQCHKEQAMHAHPTGPTVKDPNTGQPVTCGSCHGLHGSDFTFLLQQQETSLCLTCHKVSNLSE